MPDVPQHRLKDVLDHLFWIVVGVIVGQLFGPYFVGLLPGPRVDAYLEGGPRGDCFYYQIFVGSKAPLEQVSFSAQFPKQEMKYAVGTSAYREGEHIIVVTGFTPSTHKPCPVSSLAGPSPNVVASTPGPGHLVVSAIHFNETSISSVVSYSEGDPDLPGVSAVTVSGYYEYRKLGQIIRKSLEFEDRGSK